MVHTWARRDMVRACSCSERVFITNPLYASLDSLRGTVNDTMIRPEIITCSSPKTTKAYKNLSIQACMLMHVIVNE